jgi:ADP-ribose pyrophosphatase YjhB (NUDIX family)
MAQRRLITLDAGSDHFSYRVAGVAVENGHVLLHSATHESFWTLPGGHAELGEDSATTLTREMSEEMALDVEVGQLVFVVENFFNYRGRDYHELLFIHEMSLPIGFSRARDKTVHVLKEGRNELEFRWQAADEENLSRIGLLPAFLRQRLSALPTSTEHIVWREQPGATSTL